MKSSEQGVLAESDLYFHTPGELARRLYFYLLCCGHYVCDGSYRVARERYDSLLLLYVQRGEGYLTLEGRTRTLSAGSLALVDCYQPHLYGTRTGWELLWCHFDGAQARAWVDTLGNGCVAPSREAAARVLGAIFAMFNGGGQVMEAEIHLQLSQALTLLNVQETPRGGEGRMSRVLTEIANRLDEPIRLEDMARWAALSPYHFSRVFERETGCTPGAYLLRVRLNAACFHLRTGALPVREVAWRCGFGDESAFCRAFRREKGCTPGQYRAQGRKKALTDAEEERHVDDEQRVPGGTMAGTAEGRHGV